MKQRKDDALATHMDERPWFESFFGSDYLEIYEQVIASTRTEPELEGIVSMLGLGPAPRSSTSRAVMGATRYRLRNEGLT